MAWAHGYGAVPAYLLERGLRYEIIYFDKNMYEADLRNPTIIVWLKYAHETSV